MDETIERIRAALRLISPDHITPTGLRVLENILNQEETMKNLPAPERSTE